MNIIRLICLAILLLPVHVFAGNRFPVPPPHPITLIPIQENTYRDNSQPVLELTHSSYSTYSRFFFICL